MKTQGQSTGLVLQRQSHFTEETKKTDIGSANSLRGNIKEHVMKRAIRSFVVLAVFAMALTALSLAQNETYHVRANIPFDFYAGDQQLPAGMYLIDVSNGTHVVALRNDETGRTYSVLVLPANGEGSGNAVLEFDVAGGKHVLADLKTASTGVNFAESKRLLRTAQRTGSVTIVAALR